MNLIATPERFHQKRVVVAGWLTLELENMSLCLAQSPPSSKECVWIEIPEGQAGSSAWKQYSGQLVFVHGTYDKTETGHFGGWSGGIGNIVQMTPAKRR